MIAALALALSALAPAAQETIAGQPYEKLATREATRERMLGLLMPARVGFGPWHAIAPFPYAGHGRNDLATLHGPEAELQRMRAGGPGPELGRSWTGKLGREVSWRPLGDILGRPIDLHVSQEPELADLVSCYLHAAIEAERARSLELWMGSDDGLRVWLNGRLLLDKDVPRGLDPRADLVRLELERGTNHLFVKVVEGHGDFAFHVEPRQELDPRAEVQLDFLLERDFPSSRERAHYRVLGFPIPPELVLEVGGLAAMPDGRPVVSTRRGEVYLVENAYGEPPLDARFLNFAEGLHEPLGAAVRVETGGVGVYAVQRGELTRMLDEDGDGRADLYESVCDAWGLSGNYHEFAFGPKFDARGDAWVTLNVGFCGGLGKSIVPWRGWAVRITPRGELIPVCDGLRSPNGIGAWSDGAMFALDNQGDWVATNKLVHLAPGSWHGHPASLRWRKDLRSEGDRPPRAEPAVWFPYRKMGQSAADIALDSTGGAFGPFDGQLFVGDQTAASVMRVFLEKVEGVYQGACFPFLAGLACGVNRLCFLPDGSLLVGQTDRGWGSIGRKRYGLERVVHTGLLPFEILAMRADAKGFVLEFTLDVDPVSAADPGSYRTTSYGYAHHADYGAPERDTLELELRSVTQLGPRSVLLELHPLRAGHVHELWAEGVRALRKLEGGEPEPLLHPQAYYTLQRIPAASAGH